MAEQSTERPVVFVSWSGTASQSAAVVIKEWLEDIFPTIDVFFSTHDIPKGTRGEARIALQLERAIFGVLCLTPVSQGSRWVLYEAGALTGQLGDERISPLLLGVEQSQVLPPLSSVQSTAPTEEDVERLALRINAVTPNPLPEERIRRVLPMHWQKLEPGLQEAIAAAERESKDLGITAKRTADDMFAELVEGQRLLREDVRSIAAAQLFDFARYAGPEISPRVPDQRSRTVRVAKILEEVNRGTSPGILNTPELFTTRGTPAAANIDGKDEK